MSRPDTCFHCALPVPVECELTIAIDGDSMPVCCPGCKAVAELILASGMENYYAMRDRPSPGTGRPEGDSNEWEVFDRNDMLEAFAEQRDDEAIVSIYVAGMYCSACTWLIETTLGKTAGVIGAEVNPVTHRAQVRFRPSEIGLGRILHTLADLGYKPQPMAPDSTARPELIEQRTALKRLIVASLGMMQVMMFAVGLYAGEFQGMDEGMRQFLRLVSFLVTTPVVFYSARPFFTAAIRGLRARQPGMDLPVSIAIGSAYSASVYVTMSGGEAVWFDSVTMFVFFLTVGRFLEMRARHRSVERTVALSSLLPNTVTRIEESRRVVIPVSQLVAGDRVLVKAGDAIPADGTLVAGRTTVNEAVLTGESQPQQKSTGDSLVAGSVNIDGVVELEVHRTGVDTTLGTISRLSERARYARPAFVQLADRVASYIVVGILVIATAVAIAWYVLDPQRAFVVTLSVLVVTCPCALALATPAAFAATGSRLSELSLLLTNGNAVESIARSTHFLFDKTGTLTHGRPTIISTRVVVKRFRPEQCLEIAGALEAGSTHPIAAAFDTANKLTAVDCHAVVGQGVTGIVGGTTWRLGKAEFVAPDGDASILATNATTVCLGDENGVVAVFDIEDELRPDAAETLSELRQLGIRLSLLSGDSEQPVRRIAAALEIEEFHYSCSPEDKLRIIQDLQQRGDCVVMIGDGVNDAPVLSAADASVAPAHAAKLAQTSADIIMLGQSLRPIVTLLRMSRQTMRIVRQNLFWAIIYNATALPLAAAGLVPPWLAAIGMSASSLIVVLNALRLNRFS